MPIKLIIIKSSLIRQKYDDRLFLFLGMDIKFFPRNSLLQLNSKQVLSHKPAAGHLLKWASYHSYHHHIQVIALQ